MPHKANHLLQYRLTHGDRVHAATAPEYYSWVQMRSRCRNPRANPAYFLKGITVCERWEKYENFLADMGRKPSPSHTIERINNDGNYELANCKWGTKKEQSRNRKNRRIIEIEGISRPLFEWLEHFSISENTYRARLRWGLAPAVALSKPVNKRYSHR